MGSSRKNIGGFVKMGKKDRSSNLEGAWLYLPIAGRLGWEGVKEPSSRVSGFFAFQGENLWK